MGTSELDLFWIMVSGFIVLLMQAGFTCLESGMVRAKNSINVAFKNLVDFCISALLFASFGYALMFGVSQGGLVGGSHWLLLDVDTPEALAFFFFQTVFCGTAITIVSGAVAERMCFKGYMFTAALGAGLIYPIVGHWAWNGLNIGEAHGWLGALGFIDFAGSTVVHSVGGWLALAAVLVIGPRLGRFSGRRQRRIHGHNLTMAALGVFLLWFGWFGFNGGSTLALNSEIPGIIANTTLAGATGGMAALFASIWLVRRPDINHVMNGIIAGLVAITASCHLVSPQAALLIGAVGGALASVGVIMLERLRIDDAVGAVPVHLFAGIWGTLAVALFAPVAAFSAGYDRLDQLGVQLLGVTAAGVYAFGIAFVLLLLMHRVQSLRVRPRDERIGLNVSEHGAHSNLLDLITQMSRQAEDGDFSRAVRVEPETEAAEVAAYYNAVRERFQSETERRQLALQRVSDLANADMLTGLANRRLFVETLALTLRRLRSEQRSPHGPDRGTEPIAGQGVGGAVIYLDLDGFKPVNDQLGHEAGDQVLREVARRMRACAGPEVLVARLGGDEFALLMASGSRAEWTELAECLLARLLEPVVIEGSTEPPVRVGASIGIAEFGGPHPQGVLDDVKTVLARADAAMYAVKLAGKNHYRFAEVR